MHSILDQTQTAFISGRYILNNILAANEVIHYAKHHKQKRIVLKVDFEKAYDKVSWDFIEEFLLSRGFGLRWTQWVMALLKDSHTCINVNGCPSPYFICKRGLRQGILSLHTCLF
jgi:Reverse transcriptase (RNA-dependent DNA polymerase)